MSRPAGPSSLGITLPPVPGLFVTGTDTGVGKTVIAAAIGHWFRRRGGLVAVCKPIGTGCVRRREGLVSEDAELLAHWSDSRHPLDLICPQRYVEPLAPVVAAERAGRPVDWQEVNRALGLICAGSDVLIVEGVGGVLVPLDARHTVLDLALALGLPAVVVARPGLGTINHTLLTLAALRTSGVRVAGVVINRYPENASVADETNPRVIEKRGRARILCIVPDEPGHGPTMLTPGILASIEAVDWAAMTGQR